MFIDEVSLAVHSLDPDLHVALEQVREKLLGVAGEKMDGLCGGQRTHDARDGNVVVLAFYDHLRDPDLVPRPSDELANELVFGCDVHWVATRIV